MSKEGSQILIDNKIEREGFFDGDEKFKFFYVHNKLKSSAVGQVSNQGYYFLRQLWEIYVGT